MSSAPVYSPGSIQAHHSILSIFKLNDFSFSFEIQIHLLATLHPSHFQLSFPCFPN